MITEDDEFKRIESEIKRRVAQAKVTDEQGRPMTYWGGKAPEPQAEPCIGKDPRCPCQDGDACHYKNCRGTKARPVPPEQEPVAYYHPRSGFYWAKPTSIFAPTVVDVPPMPLYAAAERNK